MGFLRELIDSEYKELKRFERIANKIEALHDEMAALSDDELKAKTEEVKLNEQIILTDEEKKILTKLVIDSAKDIDLKLRISDIDKEKLSVKKEMGKKKYQCFIDVAKLGSRKKKVPKSLESKNITIKDKKIIFTYSSLEI